MNEQIAWLLSGVGRARASDHSDSKSSFSFVNDSHELEPMKIKFFLGFLRFTCVQISPTRTQPKPQR